MELPLSNKYWLLRHGRSIPNELDLVVSHEDNGVLPKYGLAPVGVTQAKSAGQLFLKELRDSGLNKVCICTSPFSRTIQTSECVLESFQDSEYDNTQIHIVHELKERYFGPRYELKSRFDYTHDDLLDPFAGPEGGESVMDVSARLIKLIHRIEGEMMGFAVLVVGHGDVLQILQAMAAHRITGTSDSEYPSFLSKHRRFELANAELRRLC